MGEVYDRVMEAIAQRREEWGPRVEVIFLSPWDFRSLVREVNELTRGGITVRFPENRNEPYPSLRLTTDLGQASVHPREALAVHEIQLYPWWGM
jgi:hypothetical protein